MGESAGLGPNDEVLEIGPGLGILTRELLRRARRVVAAELDPVLAKQLPDLAPSGCLEVVQGDALELDPAQHFAGPYKLLANLPYQITSPVLSRYLVDVRRPEVLVLMVQLEVAERVVARPGRASYLSNLVQAVADVRLVRRVAPGAFYPPPKVTSAVLHILPRAEREVSDDLLPGFLELVQAGFTQPRKTLANSLAQGLGLPRKQVEARLVAAGIDSGARPQHLQIADWLALLHARADAGDT